jgi:hypothetical protein
MMRDQWRHWIDMRQCQTGMCLPATTERLQGQRLKRVAAGLAACLVATLQQIYEFLERNPRVYSQ